jgi:hypothetical protein
MHSLVTIPANLSIYLYTHLPQACAGFGTDELLLTCCVIRYQGVMAQVMAAHIELYGMSIHDRVRAQVSGKLQQLLLQVLNAVWPEEV